MDKSSYSMAIMTLPHCFPQIHAYRHPCLLLLSLDLDRKVRVGVTHIVSHFVQRTHTDNNTAVVQQTGFQSLRKSYGQKTPPGQLNLPQSRDPCGPCATWDPSAGGRKALAPFCVHKLEGVMLCFATIEDNCHGLCDILSSLHV